MVYNEGSDRARVASTTAMMINVVHYNCLDLCSHAGLQLRLVEHRTEGGKRKQVRHAVPEHFFFVFFFNLLVTLAVETHGPFEERAMKKSCHWTSNMPRSPRRVSAQT